MNEKLKSWGTIVATMSTKHNEQMREARKAGREMGLNVVRSRGRMLYMGDETGAFSQYQDWDWAVTGKSLKAYVELAKSKGAKWVGVGCDYEARNALGGDIVEPLIQVGIEWYLEVWTAEEGWLF